MESKSGSKNVIFEYLALFILTMKFSQVIPSPPHRHFLCFLQKPTNEEYQYISESVFQMQFKGRAKLTVESLMGANLI